MKNEVASRKTDVEALTPILDAASANELLKNIICGANAELYFAQAVETQKKLYMLANAQYAQSPDLFIDMVTQGKKNSSSVCAFLVALMVPEYFDNNISQFSVMDFTALLTDGLHKGQSALWLLSMAAYDGSPEALILVLNKYKGLLKAEDFTAQAQCGQNKGRSALWLLSMTAADGDSAALILVLNQFTIGFKAKNFTEQAQAGPDKGQSALWQLSMAAAGGYSDALEFVLNKLNTKFKLDDFTIQAQGGEYKGKSALWLLSYAATADENPKTLMAVLNQHKSELKAEHLTAKAQDGGNLGVSALSHLSLAATDGKPEGLMLVLSHISFDARSLYELFPVEDEDDVVPPQNCKELIDSKIKLINGIQNEDENLAFLAKQATQAGYHEAYYDAATYYKESGDDRTAVKLFLKLPITSIHSEEISLRYSAEFLGKAMCAVNKAERYSYLRVATKFALKTSDDVERFRALHLIANAYIRTTVKISKTSNDQVIPDFLLQGMHYETKVKWCFEAFEMMGTLASCKLALKTQKRKKQCLKQAKQGQDKENTELLNKVFQKIDSLQKQPAYLPLHASASSGRENEGKTLSILDGNLGLSNEEKNDTSAAIFKL